MTITPEMIPEKAVEAAAIDLWASYCSVSREVVALRWNCVLHARYKERYLSRARAAIAAALNGWEGVEEWEAPFAKLMPTGSLNLILPLTQDKQNG